MIKIGLLVDGQNSQRWNIDYRKLSKFLKKKYNEFTPRLNIKNLYIIMEEEPSSEKMAFLAFMKSIGFRTIERRVLNELLGKPDVDAHIGSDLRKYSDHCDIIVLIAGDGDFLPVLKDLVQEKGQEFLIISRRDETATELREIKKNKSGMNIIFLDEIDIMKDVEYNTVW